MSSLVQSVLENLSFHIVMLETAALYPQLSPLVRALQILYLYVCVYVYVCMYVYMYVCMYVCMYVYMYVPYVCISVFNLSKYFREFSGFSISYYHPLICCHKATGH